MKPFLTRIVIGTVLKYKYRNKSNFSSFALAKAYRELIILIRSHLKDSILILIGIFSAAFGLKGFLLTNHFIDGGVTGISLLVSSITDIPLYTLIVVINIPFIIMAYYNMGQQFAVKTAIAIFGLSLCLGTIDFPNITDDNLLVAVFGGFFLGAGIGFAVRGGAVIDGTEVLAIQLSRKLSTTIGDIIIIINVIIFLTAAYFLGVEKALYSMITYLSASKTLDFLVEGIEEYTGVTIVSSKCEDIRLMIIDRMGRGVTVYKGKRGYGKRGERAEIDVIYTVLTRLELNKFKTEMEKIDPNAFIVMNSVKEIKGGMIKKRPLQH